MPSQFDADFAAAVSPDILTVFGATITHRRGGDPAQDVTVTAIWTFDEQVASDRARQLAIEQGNEDVVIEADVQIAESVTVDMASQWVRQNRVYSTLWIGDAEAGLRTVRVGTSQVVTRGRAGNHLK